MITRPPIIDRNRDALPWRQAPVARLVTVVFTATALLTGCDEREVGVHASVLVTAEVLEVRSLQSRSACTTLTSPEARKRVARVMAHYAEWPEVAECSTPFCRDVVAHWRSGRLYMAEVGVCADRVTVHMPGPQKCGRAAPPEATKELLSALNAPS